LAVGPSKQGSPGSAMAPASSKSALAPRDVVALTARKLRPALDELLEVLEESLQKGRLFVGEVCRARLVLEKVRRLALEAARASSARLGSWSLRESFLGSKVPLSDTMPMLFVCGIIALLYNAFVFFYMPAAGIAFDSPTSLLFHSFIFLVLASYAKAVATDPGGIPESQEWRCYGEPPPSLRERKRFTGEARWCRKSGSYKPDRAHYCRVLGRGVLRMDHHCVWMGNTIGFANHKFFFLFLAYVNAACSTFHMSVLQLLVHATLPALSGFLLIGAESLALLLSLILGPFFLFHCWLLVRNMTTVEYCESTRDEKEETTEKSKEAASDGSPYDLGIYRNLCSVLGSDPLLWWLPVGGPPGDGLAFPRRAEAVAEAAEAEERSVAVASTLGVEAVDEVDEAGRGDGHGIDPEVEVEEAGKDGADGSDPDLEDATSRGGQQRRGCTDAGGDVWGAMTWSSATELLGLSCQFLAETVEDSAIRLRGIVATESGRGRKRRKAARTSHLRPQVAGTEHRASCSSDCASGGATQSTASACSGRASTASTGSLGS